MIQYSGILKKNFLSFKNGENDSFEKYYMLLVEIKDLNTLIDNEQFFDVPIKNKQELFKKPFEMPRNNHYTKENLLDYLHHRTYCKIIGIHLPRKTKWEYSSAT